MLTYADVCRRMLTNALAYTEYLASLARDEAKDQLARAEEAEARKTGAYADVCRRMLPYADVF